MRARQAFVLLLMICTVALQCYIQHMIMTMLSLWTWILIPMPNKCHHVQVQLFQLIGCVVFPLIRFSRVHLFYIKNIFMSCGCELHHPFFASFSQTNKNEKNMCIASYFAIYGKMMERKEAISFNLNRFFFLFLFCYHSNQKKIVRLLLTATQILVNILSIIFALRMSLKFGKNIRCFTCEPFFQRHCCKRAPLL